MFTTIINDCQDDNARGRQETRIGSLIPNTTTSFVGVHADIQAGMQLIDMLDASEGRPGLILVNVAPRGGHTTKWENGTPFAYFKYQDTWVVSTVDGYALSGVKKFGLVDEVHLLDTHAVSAVLTKAGILSEKTAMYIPRTQFRSFDFIPRVGAFLAAGGKLPSEVYSLTNVPDLPHAVWHIDSFGNCKTTLTPENIATTETADTRFGSLPYFEQLRNVPDAVDALVRGSSGLGEVRFLELMSQRRNFAAHHNVKIGDDVFTEASYFTRATE